MNPAETFIHILLGEDNDSTSLYARLDTLPVAGPGTLECQEHTVRGQRVRLWLSINPNRPEGA